MRNFLLLNYSSVHGTDKKIYLRQLSMYSVTARSGVPSEKQTVEPVYQKVRFVITGTR